jgi:hypothetical protein
VKIDTYSRLVCAESIAKRDRDWGGCSPFFIRSKDQDIKRLKRGGCYEREKQRGKGKQEGATEKPEREEKDEEGEEEQVGWRVSMIRQDEWDRISILEFTTVVSSIKKLALLLISITQRSQEVYWEEFWMKGLFCMGLNTLNN